MGAKSLVVIAPYLDRPVYHQLMATLTSMLPRGVPVYTCTRDVENLANTRVLFAIALDRGGLNRALFSLYERMDQEPGLFINVTAALCVSGESELYTKSTARELVFRANLAGCTFLGRCLVEATASMKNFELRARLMGTDLVQAWETQLRQLLQRLVVLYSTNRVHRANTVRLWELISQGLNSGIEIATYNVGKGAVYDCRGCWYERCLRLGCPERGPERDLMTETLHGAIEACDALVILAPNLNDSIGPDLAAVINRLTYLSNTDRIQQQALYAVIVSGYSGGDLLTRQLLNALCINKNFLLPPTFALMQTANRPLSILEVPDIQGAALNFATCINKQLVVP